jgi:hypothetical protein
MFSDVLCNHNMRSNSFDGTGKLAIGLQDPTSVGSLSGLTIDVTNARLKPDRRRTID